MPNVVEGWIRPAGQFGDPCHRLTLKTVFQRGGCSNRAQRRPSPHAGPVDTHVNRDEDRQVHSFNRTKGEL